MVSSDRQRVLVVDGYNVLRSGDYYHSVREQMPDYGSESMNNAREALINDVAIFAGQDYQAVVVFDGGGNAFSDGQSSLIGRVEVVYSAAGVSADSVIEERVKQAKAGGAEVLVITSDAATQWTILGRQVSRMSAEGFCRELGQLQSEAQDNAKWQPASKFTLAERLDPAVLADLKSRFG